MESTLAVAFGNRMAKRNLESDKKTDNRLAKYLKMFTDSWTYAQQNYHVKWENNWKLYHNQRVKRSHDGAVKTFVPMVNSSINTIVAGLFNSNPSIKYIPNHPDQEQDTDVLNEIYADFARRDGWVEKNKANGRQGLITGNFCTYYEWKQTKDGGYVHKINVPVRDMIIDPQSHSYEDWRYVGRRFFAPLKQLKKEKIYDFETGKYVSRYKNLDMVTPDGSNSDFESDKVKKDQALGTTAPDDADMVELIEIWTHKRVVVIANRVVVIEDKENPHYAMEKSMYEQRKAEHEMQQMAVQEEISQWNSQRAMTLATQGYDIGEYQGETLGDFEEEWDEEHAGLMPFAQGRDYADISLPYGDSDVDIIADQQELLNDITELNVEAILYQLYPEKTLDPKFSNWADNLDPRPGKVYTLPAGALNWNNPPAIPANAFNERMSLKDEIREAIAVSDVSKGVMSAGSNTTATEIKAMVGQADIRIQEKAQTLAHDFFFQEAKIVLKLIQMYAPDEMWVRSMGDAGVTFLQMNPRKFLGDYTPMVTLDVERRLEKQEQQDAYMQAFQIIIQDPSNNLQAAKEILYKKMMPELTEEEIQQIITPQQPELPPEAMQGQPQEEMPMEEVPMQEQIEEPIPDDMQQPPVEETAINV